MEKVGVKFARKAFKWTQGAHKTDNAPRERFLSRCFWVEV